MKRLVCIIAAMFILMAGTAYAAPAWTDDPPGLQTAESTAETDKTLEHEAPVYGYMGNAGYEVDVDGDGTADMTVPAEDIIDVTVPLDVMVVATYNGAQTKLYSAVGTVANHSGANAVDVEMISFRRNAGQTTDVVLAAWGSTLNQHKIALKIQPTEDSLTKFTAQDVTTIRETSAVGLGQLGPGQYTEYAFDGQFLPNLIAVHKGETVKFTAGFKFAKAGA